MPRATRRCLRRRRRSRASWREGRATRSPARSAGAPAPRRRRRSGRRAAAAVSPPAWSSAMNEPPRARVDSRITSARRAICAAEPGASGGPSRSRIRSANAISTPPAELGGHVTNSVSRNAARIGLETQRLVRGEILGRERAAVLADAAEHVLGQVAAVERVGALAREQLQRAREIAHRRRLAELQRPLVAVDPPPFLVEPEDRVEDHVEARVRLADRNAVPSGLDRRREELAPGKPAVHAVRLGEARRSSPGTAHDGRADEVRDDGSLVELDVHRRHRGAPRRRSRGRAVRRRSRAPRSLPTRCG